MARTDARNQVQKKAKGGINTVRCPACARLKLRMFADVAITLLELFEIRAAGPKSKQVICERGCSFGVLFS